MAAAAEHLPICVSTVYLRVKPARPVAETPETLRFGFRASVAPVALRAVGRDTWTPVLNVNDLLDGELAGIFAWVDDPVFRALVTGGTDGDR